MSTLLGFKNHDFLEQYLNDHCYEMDISFFLLDKVKNQCNFNQIK